MTTKLNLLRLFRNYVDQCIARSTDEVIDRPKSFDEWYNLFYLPNQATLDATLDKDEEESGKMYEMEYTCPKCGEEWKEEGDCACNSECPNGCCKDIQPTTFHEITYTE